MQLLRTAICFLCTLAAGCTLMLSGDAMDGRVVDSETGAPIPGALVIVEWKGDIGGPVQSSQVCFHLEVVRTDDEGRYHVPAWHRRPAADWEGGFYGVRNTEVTKRTYKPGYVYLVDSNVQHALRMRPFHGSTAERLEYLRYLGTPGCGREDGSLPKEIALWTDICTEARALPHGNESPHLSARSSFITEVNAHFASVLSGSAQQKYDSNRKTGVECVDQ